MLTIRSAHCICFYRFKQDQLRSTIFNSITNYIFLLLKLFTVFFSFCLSPFLKNIQEAEQLNVDLFISLILGALNEVSCVNLVSCNKGLK